MSDYCYVLYINNEIVTKTPNLDYAIYWLLNNIKNSRVDILCLINDDDNNYIYEGSYKFEDGLMRYHKLYSNSLNNYTKYSPYDLSVFRRADLCLLYLQLLNNNQATSTQVTSNQVTSTQITSNQVTSNQVTSTQITSNQVTSNNQQNLSKQIIETNKDESLKKQLNNTLESCKNMLLLPSSTVDNNILQKSNDLSSSESSSTISSEDIKQIEAELDDMLKQHKENNEKLEEIVCEENFKKKKAFRENEREKEKKNKFTADLKMYKQLLAELEELNKEDPTKKIYDIVPILFLAKFYVIEFIDKNDYLLDEDVDSPSEELYQIYNMLYNVKYNPNNEDNILDKYDEEFYELINEFLEATEDKHAPDETVIREELNKKSDVIAML